MVIYSLSFRQAENILINNVIDQLPIVKYSESLYNYIEADSNIDLSTTSNYTRNSSFMSVL